MFDSLSDRLNDTFDRLRGKGKLTEADITSAMRDIRMALLEADVNFKVVKEFINRVTERAIGAEVLESLMPAQQVIKIVNEELTALMGAEASKINIASQPPTVIMMVGLQGAGKTTNAAKLAGLMRRQFGKRPLLVACDVYRPAAIDQLKTVSAQAGADFFESTPDQKPLDIARMALDHAKRHFYDVLIVDTAGRLAIDEAMMQEVSDLADFLNPAETLFVIDAMLGQDAVNTARAFNERLTLTGVVLTKLDGDSRGGAALSVRMVTGKPIKFVGLGEKLDGFELFNPEQMAGRILGMGDIVSLVKDVQKSVDQKTVEKLAKKIKSGDKFDLEDFKGQISQMKNMGPISGIIEKLPAQFQQAAAHVNDKDAAKQIRRTEGIINSMTPKERRNPEIIKASRKRRIAAGAGVTVQEVNRLLKQFEQTRDVMKHMQKGGMAKMMRALGQLGGRFGGFGRR